MSHKERIERAQEAASKQLCQCDPCNACVGDIVEAFLGDTVLYQIDTDKYDKYGTQFNPVERLKALGVLVQAYPEVAE